MADIMEKQTAQNEKIKRAVIVAGGSIENPEYYRGMFEDNDLILCADSGYRNAWRIGLTPDIVIGDFDSFPAQKVMIGEKIILPEEKDRTDSHECVCRALDFGVSEIIMLGAVGSRIDHTLANIHLLKLALDKGVTMKIINEHNEIFLIDNMAVIQKKEGWHFSLLPVEKTEGITLEGLYYPLHDAIMEFGNPYGVSNEFTADQARVSIQKGLLLAVLSRD